MSFGWGERVERARHRKQERFLREQLGFLREQLRALETENTQQRHAIALLVLASGGMIRVPDAQVVALSPADVVMKRWYDQQRRCEVFQARVTRASTS